MRFHDTDLLQGHARQGQQVVADPEVHLPHNSKLVLLEQIVITVHAAM